MKNMNTIAAIDIGSNAVRFLISNIEEDSDKKCRKVAFLRVPVRLGEDAFTSGTISEERRARLCEAMQSFDHLMKAFGVRDYRACATSAMRDAKNGPEVLAEIKEKSNIDVEIISGEKEAEIIYAAAQPFIASAGGGGEKNSLHVDVGGGSTEVVVYAEGRVAESYSFPLGTVRLLNKAVSSEEKDDFKAALREIGGKYSIQRIIASGGNINKAQKLLNKREGEPVSYIELKMLYDMLKKNDLRGAHQELQAQPLPRRRNHPRAENLPHHQQALRRAEPHSPAGRLSRRHHSEALRGKTLRIGRTRRRSHNTYAAPRNLRRRGVLCLPR